MKINRVIFAITMIGVSCFSSQVLMDGLTLNDAYKGQFSTSLNTSEGIYSPEFDISFDATFSATTPHSTGTYFFAMASSESLRLWLDREPELGSDQKLRISYDLGGSTSRTTIGSYDYGNSNNVNFVFNFTKDNDTITLNTLNSDGLIFNIDLSFDLDSIIFRQNNNLFNGSAGNIQVSDVVLSQVPEPSTLSLLIMSFGIYILKRKR